MIKGIAWGVLGLASILAYLPAAPARAIWTSIGTPAASAPAAPADAPPAPAVASQPQGAIDPPVLAQPLDEAAPTEEDVVEIVLDESPAPELLAAGGRRCCLYKSGSIPPVDCRERTCVPLGDQCPLELHGCPLWKSFSVNSCGACR